jgi:hypothetical protein
MLQQLTIKLSLDEANVILAALGNLPFIQVHSLIHNLQNQVAPQLADIEQKSMNQTNGKESKILA